MVSYGILACIACPNDKNKNYIRISAENSDDTAGMNESIPEFGVVGAAAIFHGG